jgi:hypothetical protein
MPANVLQNLDSLFRDLERLTEDLRKLRAGDGPSQRTLQACPVINQWSFGFLPAPCLVGAVSGHPILDNSNIHTSELVIIDRDKRWARTWSRFYRLGVQQRNECRTDDNWH